LDIDHRWNPGNQSFDPVTNQFGSAKSAVSKNIWLAGDGAKILGADAAIISGKIVAEDVLDKFSFASFDPSRRKNLLKQKDRFGPVRQFLDECYRPSTEILDPDGDVIVCRCEEVKALDVREAIALGAQGPNQLKVFTRCGMGNCQGRYCGLTVSQMVASARDMELDEVGYYRIRTPLKPITLKELSTYYE
jgi:bacterioferritin-associated ferredoxin